MNLPQTAHTNVRAGGLVENHTDDPRGAFIDLLSASPYAGAH